MIEVLDIGEIRLQEKESFIVDCQSPDGKWVAVFEDNAESGCLYLCTWDAKSGKLIGIMDNLWIYDAIWPSIEEFDDVFITWSDDSTRFALIVEDECWGIVDLQAMRKLAAPREDNCIREIDFEFWEKGLSNQDGEALQLEKLQVQF